jgi:predicted HD phosphohydrolase
MRRKSLRVVRVIAAGLLHDIGHAAETLGFDTRHENQWRGLSD